MELRCARCATSFITSYPERYIRTLACPQCKSPVSPAKGVQPLAPEGWLVRKPEASELIFDSIISLKEGIFMELVELDDYISKSGSKWIQARDVPELRGFIQQIRNVSSQQTNPPLMTYSSPRQARSYVDPVMSSLGPSFDAETSGSFEAMESGFGDSVKPGKKALVIIPAILSAILIVVIFVLLLNHLQDRSTTPVAPPTAEDVQSATP